MEETKYSKYHIVLACEDHRKHVLPVLIKHLKAIPVFADHHPQLLPYESIKDDAGFRTTYSDREQVNKTCLVIDGYAQQYGNSIQRLAHATDDFMAGWNAHEAMVAQEAVAAEKARAEKAAAKEAKNRIKAGDQVVLKNSDARVPTVYDVLEVTPAGYGSYDAKILAHGDKDTWYDWVNITRLKRVKKKVSK